MGCITLEFIVWLLYGADGLQELSRDLQAGSEGSSSKYNGTFHDGTRASPTVLGWLRRLKDWKHPAKRIIELVLDLVQHDILEVPEKRLPAGEIYRSLQGALRRAEEAQQSSFQVDLDEAGPVLDSGPDLSLMLLDRPLMDERFSGIPQVYDSWFHDSAFYTGNTGMTELSEQGNKSSFDSSSTSWTEPDWQSWQDTTVESDFRVMSSSVTMDSAYFDVLPSAGAGEDWEHTLEGLD